MVSGLVVRFLTSFDAKQSHKGLYLALKLLWRLLPFYSNELWVFDAGWMLNESENSQIAWVSKPGFLRLSRSYGQLTEQNHVSHTEHLHELV